MDTTLQSEKWPRPVKLFGLAGALLQISLAACLGFLPVFALCTSVDSPCQYRPYAEQGGSLVGYALFTTMIVLGVLVVVSLTRPCHLQSIRLLWVGALASLGVCILTAWGLGITFLPGAILLSAAAFYSHNQPRLRQAT